jgi:demethylmenaquinone methyltransferase / 2-methoxy-6-polyprenyl-1,4-benzoquinol methylase
VTASGRPAPPVDRDPRRIAAMFASIASRYDLMNRVMTLGLDTGWRREAAMQVEPRPGERVLDACCGTGDLAFTLAETYPSCEVTGLDFSEAMLLRAREKATAREYAAEPQRGGPHPGRRLPARRRLPAHRRPLAPLTFVHGDVLQLPFADGSFAAVTVGWGVRNVSDVTRAFAEMRRVTRVGGRVVCLDSTQAPPGLQRRL